MNLNILDIFDRNDTEKIVRVPIGDIHPSRYQPRLHFDETALAELTESIRENGLIQPITVRKSDSGYEGNEFKVGEAYPASGIQAYKRCSEQIALGLPDRRFVCATQFVLNLPCSRGILQCQLGFPFMLIDLGSHAVNNRFAGPIVGFLNIIDRLENIFLRLVRLAHGHIYTCECVI